MIVCADARQLPLADGCVQCVVTSPPYFGLRDYGSVNQIGLEPTPAAYVGSLVTVFREVWRVLRADGTVWLNLGDSYASGSQGAQGGTGQRAGRTFTATRVMRKDNLADVKAKDLIGIPWRVAFALQAEGWYLRSDIIWAKPNPMPESVTDRPTKAHEYLFLLSKSERYVYDAAAIAEPSLQPMGNERPSGNTTWQAEHQGGARTHTGRTSILGSNQGAATRNKRSVWTIPTMPYAGAHFATMPEALIEPCILAGCPLGGLVCDPFLGSGTVGAVAARLGRRWVGTDLAYHDLAAERTAQRGLAFA